EGGDRDKLGRGWVWSGQIADCIHQNHVFRARLKTSEINPRFVSYWANTVAQGWFERRGKQTTNLASINRTILSALPVPVAPPEEQARVIAEIERRLSLLDAVDGVVDANERRAVVLRRAVLRGAFSGELVVSRCPGSSPVEQGDVG